MQPGSVAELAGLEAGDVIIAVNRQKVKAVADYTKAAKGKKAKCITKTTITGLKIVGGKAKSVAIKGGKLVITLKKPAGTVSLTLTGKLVSESKSLQTKVKKHKTKALKFALKVTDAKHKSTTLPLKLRAH